MQLICCVIIFIAELEKGRNTQFDTDIIDIMLQIINEDTEYTLHQ